MITLYSVTALVARPDQLRLMRRIVSTATTVPRSRNVEGSGTEGAGSDTVERNWLARIECAAVVGWKSSKKRY